MGSLLCEKRTGGSVRKTPVPSSHPQPLEASETSNDDGQNVVLNYSRPNSSRRSTCGAVTTANNMVSILEAFIFRFDPLQCVAV